MENASAYARAQESVAWSVSAVARSPSSVAQETERAGMSAFLGDPIPLTDFLQDVEENIECPKWMF